MYHIKTSAKVNLGITVLGKLGNGYHEIETIMIPVGIYDEIFIDFSLENPEKEISIEGNFSVPTDENNIIWKTVKFVENIVYRQLGFKAKIKKNIPVGSGLGGGSSNAAGVLKCLLSFLKERGIITSEIENMILTNSHRIGADVPFFLRNGAKIAQGIGEKLTTLPNLVEKLEKYKIIIVYPGINISTKEAYKFIDEMELLEGKRWAHDFYNKFIKNEIDVRNFKQMLKNPFESFILKRVKEIKDFLYLESAMFALMSGSGSAVYGLFEEDAELSKVKSKLVNDLLVPDKFIFETRFVNEPFLNFLPEGFYESNRR